MLPIACNIATETWRTASLHAGRRILSKQTSMHCLSPFTCNEVTLVGRLSEVQRLEIWESPTAREPSACLAWDLGLKVESEKRVNTRKVVRFDTLLQKFKEVSKIWDVKKEAERKRGAKLTIRS